MEDCKFCNGDVVYSEEVNASGIRTMGFNLRTLLGLEPDGKKEDGIWLSSDNYITWDNSSGEYGSQRVKIGYCPFCGRKLEDKKEE